MLTLKPENIKVGTTLFFIGNTTNKNGVTVTINKVGRKWAYWGDRDYERLDLTTMKAWHDGYGHENVLWDSEESYKTHIHKISVIQACRDALISHYPNRRRKLTYEKAVKILAIFNDEA